MHCITTIAITEHGKPMDVLAFTSPEAAQQAWNQARADHADQLINCWTEPDRYGPVSYFETRDGYAQRLQSVPVEQPGVITQDLLSTLTSANVSLQQAQEAAIARYNRMCQLDDQAAVAWETYGGQALDAFLQSADRMAKDCRLDLFEAVLVFMSTAIDRLTDGQMLHQPALSKD